MFSENPGIPRPLAVVVPACSRQHTKFPGASLTPPSQMLFLLLYTTLAFVCLRSGGRCHSIVDDGSMLVPCLMGSAVSFFKVMPACALNVPAEISALLQM